jgi:predicted house-cleaning noncanonical NTP pyrophosphatase (MazG superfamily)
MKYDGYKLVRDKIPDIIKESGGSGETDRVTGLDDYRSLLWRKMLEEVDELQYALTTEKQSSIEDELADVFEVLMAIGDTHRCRHVVDVAQEKLSRRGGFYQGYVLKVDNPDE